MEFIASRNLRIMLHDGVHSLFHAFIELSLHIITLSVGDPRGVRSCYSYGDSFLQVYMTSIVTLMGTHSSRYGIHY